MNWEQCLTFWMQDIVTLGIVNVRYGGYVAVVKVEGREEKNVSPPSQSIELEQPEGGANALNINRFLPSFAMG